MRVDREIDMAGEGGEHDDYTDGEDERDYTWSVNLELQEHADDRERIIDEAMEAVRQTAPGYFVNVVTHEEHGHPSEYLYRRLREGFDDIRCEYVEQCGCGGYVTRVHVD